MNIDSLVINIKNEKNEVEISPIYEVHTWADAEKIITRTRELLADTKKTFSFSVIGAVR